MAMIEEGRRRLTRWLSVSVKGVTSLALAATGLALLAQPRVASAAAPGGVARAQAAVLAAEATPTKILQSVPLKTRPPRGKTIVFIQDEIPQSGVIGAGEQAAAKAAGWNFKELNYLSSNPTTLITAMKQALQYKPFAVSFAGEVESTWASMVPVYKAAHVYIIPCVIGPQKTNGVVAANIGHFETSGVGLGNWFISASNGRGHALLVDLPVFPVLTEVITGIKHAIAANCSACVTTAYNGTLADVGDGQFVPNIVTALKKDPTIKYVLSSDLFFISSLTSALASAGMTGITIAGAQPEASDFAAISAGTEAATVVNSNTVIGWIAADAMFRLAEHMHVSPNDGGNPYQLIVQTNTNMGLKDEPANYAAQFKILWKLQK